LLLSIQFLLLLFLFLLLCRQALITWSDLIFQVSAKLILLVVSFRAHGFLPLHLLMLQILFHLILVETHLILDLGRHRVLLLQDGHGALLGAFHFLAGCEALGFRGRQLLVSHVQTVINLLQIIDCLLG